MTNRELAAGSDFRGRVAPATREVNRGPAVSAEDSARPFWSVMIPTYHCSGFLRATLSAVLQQDPGAEQMQIMVVDDHSLEDDPETVVRELGKGRVEFYRQPTNQGVVGNLNTCLNLSRGYWVHLLHGDDLVRPGFYRGMQTLIGQYPDLGAAFCRYAYIDAEGHTIDLGPCATPSAGKLTDAFRYLGSEQRIMTPSIVVRRKVYEELGGFDARLLCAEDWEMWMRIAARYPIGYEPEVLAEYRMHTHSNTGRNIRNGRDLDHTRLAIELFSTYVDPKLGDEVRRIAFRTYAATAIESAQRLARAGDWTATRAQLQVALRLRPGLRTRMAAARVLARAAWQSLVFRRWAARDGASG